MKYIFETYQDFLDYQAVNEIGEASVRPYAWKWTDSTSTDWSADFHALEWKYNVTVNPVDKEGNFQINFGIYLGGEVNYRYESNSGDMFKVLATVVDIAKDAIEKRDIKSFIIAPSRSKSNDSRRLKLYMAYIKRQLPGAKVNVEKTSTKFLGKTSVKEVIMITL